MNILYVENHAIFANNAIRQFLFDCDVVLVSSLLAAQEKLKNDKYDILMIDYDLDDGKGETLVRQLRTSGYSGKIIAVSAHEHKNEILLNSGADNACGKTNFGKIRQIFLGSDLKEKAQDAKISAVEAENEGKGAYLNENNEKEKYYQKIEGQSFVLHCGYQIFKISIAASRINEDRAEILTYPNGFILVIADGAGGISGGERAAEIIIEKTRKITDSMNQTYRKLN